MNIKITKEERRRLVANETNRYLFGSHLFLMNTKHSDVDIAVIYDDPFPKTYLPNIHQFQYDGKDFQEVWFNHDQFFKGLFNGDGIIQIDIVLFDKQFQKDYPEDWLKVLRTKKVLKSLLGYAKRDLNSGRLFFAEKSFYLAHNIMYGHTPSTKEIRSLVMKVTQDDIKQLRSVVMDEYDKGTIQDYYIPECTDTLHRKQLESNNTREFRYGS